MQKHVCLIDSLTFNVFFKVYLNWNFLRLKRKLKIVPIECFLKYTRIKNKNNQKVLSIGNKAKFRPNVNDKNAAYKLGI